MATQPMQAAQKKISPAERAMLFAQATRQNWQMLPAVAISENNSASFTIPKVRLLSKIRLYVQATMNLVHASGTAASAATFAPFNLLKNVRVEINNGFTPFNISGQSLYVYNLLRDNAAAVKLVSSATAATAAGYRNRTVMGLESASGGKDNVVRFCLDLPFTLNDRDPVGLILAQNEETVITVTVDLNDADVLLSSLTGYTVALSNAYIYPMIETFSIPAVPEAFPDISILKLVQQKKETISGSGVVNLSLPPGTTYRKLLLYIEDSSGGELDTDITGDFELVFNQADTPYRIKPYVLNAINQEQYGTTLPQGLWVFDLSYQGLAGYGGARDYIDTERLTEFWFRFTAAGAGSITAIYETLSRLRGI